MKKMQHLILSALFTLLMIKGFSQSPRFNLVLDEKKNSLAPIYSVTQDLQGYIWFTSISKGLYRYDGNKLNAYIHDKDNKNSLAGNFAITVSADSSGNIWVGFIGQGIDRYDPLANKFTHFRHDPKNPESLVNDSIFCIATDSKGDLWVGTLRGLDKYEKNTGKFIHYNIDERLKNTTINNGNSILSITAIYEDKNGMLWLGWGDPFQGKKEGVGGLASLDRTTGKITRYQHNPADPNSIMDNNVYAIFEDSRNNLWVGTRSNGLHTLNRVTGKFTRYNYDPGNPEKLSGPPVSASSSGNLISFITEDGNGNLWVGSESGGINMYNPATKKTTHFGTVQDDKTGRYAKDTLNGFSGTGGLCALLAKDGLLWITENSGKMYNINFSKVNIPFTPLNSPAVSFYLEEEKNILWIGTDSSLIRKDLKTGLQKQFRYQPTGKNSLAGNFPMAISGDGEGNLWIGYHDKGVQKLNIETGVYAHYTHDSTKANSLADDGIHILYFDRQKNLWIGTHNGLSKMNIRTGICINYKHNSKDSSSLGAGSTHSIVEDKNGNFWVATDNDLNYLDIKTGKIKRYEIGSSSFNVYIDASGKVWAGAINGLYYMDTKKNDFRKYTDPVFPNGITSVFGILEDHIGQLWVNTDNAIICINQQRNAVKVFNATHGVSPVTNLWFRNIKSKDGRIFLGGQKGYFSFIPDEIDAVRTAPLIQFTNLKIDNKEVPVGENSVLPQAIWKTTAIELAYDQNTFSFEFNALDYKNPGEIKFLYKLENYDEDWRDIGIDKKVPFYNVPSGKYVLHIKAINGEGSSAQKSMAITITPPWWKTWWAYSLYALLVIVAGYLIYRYQKYYIVKKERERTQQKELAQAKEIEKAYTELKATQNQLIQSEKMASLGELTAGIAHEIQNPLNFVNNFSEVNSELIAEMKDELSKGNIDEAKKVADDINENEQKIIYHGKRADAIVKGMLQHSRSSSGIKEPTDINALCDEYLRLSYHGLRAKDKSFNATIKTKFDETLDKVNVIPQDIGRVLLNLINNAFFAVTEKKKTGMGGYEPTVSVSTKKINNKIEISVKDNGNGIPEQVKEKIFQPFFTTKPTGQGTGLGLSLSYDIVKAHGGELEVETKESNGAEFKIILPI